MKTRILLFCYLTITFLAAEVPNGIPHQGRIAGRGVNVAGPEGRFAFLLFHDRDRDHNNGSESPVWSTSATNPADMSMPALIGLPVNKGLFSVWLGDTDARMPALPDSVEPPPGNGLYLRTWFSDGASPAELLAPDQPIGAVPFARHAATANTLSLGSNTEATGLHALSIGTGTVAPSLHEVAFGRYNTRYVPDSATGWEFTDRVFVIGNGTNDAKRSDLLSVRKNGLMQLSGNLIVSGSATLGSGSADDVTFLGRVGSHLTSDGAFRNLGSAGARWSQLFVQEIDSQGDVTVGGNLNVEGGIAFDSPQTNHKLIPGNQFVINPVLSDLDGWEKDDEEGHIFNVGAGQDLVCSATFSLPDGAVIQAIEFLIRDSAPDVDFSDMDFSLRERGLLQTSTSQVLSNQNEMTGGTNNQLQRFTINGPFTTDSQCYYLLKADLQRTLDVSPLIGFYGASIEYTIDRSTH